MEFHGLLQKYPPSYHIISDAVRGTDIRVCRKNLPLPSPEANVHAFTAPPALSQSGSPAPFSSSVVLIQSECRQLPPFPDHRLLLCWSGKPDSCLLTIRDSKLSLPTTSIKFRRFVARYCGSRTERKIFCFGTTRGVLHTPLSVRILILQVLAKSVASDKWLIWTF